MYSKKMKIKKSQAVGLKELIATLVVSGLLLIVGIVVFASVGSTVDTQLTGTGYAEATATVANVSSTTYDAFELTTVALIVLAAAVIIGILIRAFGA